MRSPRLMLIAIVAAIPMTVATTIYVSPYVVGSVLAVQQAPTKVDTGEFGDIFSRPVLKKSSQLKFLIFIADGPNGVVEGPMTRAQADAEMKLYVDADATLMVEDGNGGYIDVKSHQSMQKILASRDPDWDK